MSNESRSEYITVEDLIEDNVALAEEVRWWKYMTAVAAVAAVAAWATKLIALL